ncbi:hypothetical protein P167DRAFT_180094 [Morchella conica CCBAS932]|uniref:Uncharacterized protein n=1 Tax=Morchella conica CCBAS932 TaxID=1392247 RepID=A0A3N4KMZ9_9PEZI|nr:hypothetical protein P167DRAFT_180094 [Morchella conica CCBAS932]
MLRNGSIYTQSSFRRRATRDIFRSSSRPRCRLWTQGHVMGSLERLGCSKLGRSEAAAITACTTNNDDIMMLRVVTKAVLFWGYTAAFVSGSCFFFSFLFFSLLFFSLLFFSWLAFIVFIILFSSHCFSFLGQKNWHWDAYGHGLNLVLCGLRLRGGEHERLRHSLTSSLLGAGYIPQVLLHMGAFLGSISLHHFPHIEGAGERGRVGRGRGGVVWEQQEFFDFFFSFFSFLHFQNCIGNPRRGTQIWYFGGAQELGARGVFSLHFLFSWPVFFFFFFFFFFSQFAFIFF